MNSHFILQFFKAFSLCLCLILAVSHAEEFLESVEELSSPEKTETPDKTFQNNSMDTLLDNEKIPIRKIFSVDELKKGEHWKNSSNKSGEKVYRILLESIADFKQAQLKRNEFSKHLGTNVDIIFENPFYLLKFGRFTSQKSARKKMEYVQSMGIQGFIIAEN